MRKRTRRSPRRSGRASGRFPQITEELLRRGHAEAEIRGVLGENFLRFLVRVEETAASLAHELPDATPFPARR
ncbi:MAG TPA: membrane dipeptidase [Thermoanaerobaculia bacterium]|nr:membrane dipeptidase [Thermoanaerobaculia bacterium]